MSRSKPVQAGDYNRWFVWQSLNPNPPRDALGQPSRTVSPYTDQTGFWASKTPATGRESINGERLKATISHVVECLIPGDIQPKDRLKGINVITGETNYLNIEAVQNVDDGNFTVKLYCTEVVNPAKVVT